nr:MAG TPA: hypothetical protein [Caudoviricetes sp.]
MCRFVSFEYIPVFIVHSCHATSTTQKPRTLPLIDSN